MKLQQHLLSCGDLWKENPSQIIIKAVVNSTDLGAGFVSLFCSHGNTVNYEAVHTFTTRGQKWTVCFP